MAIIKEVGSNKKLYAEFDSVYGTMATIKRLGWEPQRSKASDERGKDYGGSFYSFGSLAEAFDVFENNPEKIRQFSINDDKLTSPESPGKDVEFDVTGDFLDVDRYLEGIPEVFGNAVMGNPKSMFCTINLLDTYVYYMSSDYIMEKQKRVLRLVDWLESQGIRCQVVAAADSSVMFSSTVVKQFGDPFNLNDLAVAMHPDWLRRIKFLMMEQSKTWQSGYGSASQYDNRMMKYKPSIEDGLYIYIGGYEPYGDNDKKKLNKAFDKIESSVQGIIDEGLTYNEEPLTVGKSSDYF